MNATIYRVKPNAYGVDVGLKGGWQSRTPHKRYYDIVEVREVPVNFLFESSYRNELSYSVVGGINNGRCVNYRTACLPYVDPWATKSSWNYTEDDFERIVNGSIFIPHFLGGDALSKEEFEVFKLLHPEALLGDYDVDEKTWRVIR